MNLSRNSYTHIRSFADFENEKMKLYYQIKLSEKKLELRYIELLSFLNPMRLVPFLVSSWLTPMVVSLRDLIVSFFRKNTYQTATSEHDEKEE